MKKTRINSVNAASVETGKPIVRKEVEASADRLGVLDVDSQLAAHKDHLLYRFQELKAKKEAFEKYEGGLEEFSLGYKKLGFIRENGAIVYKEWVPTAKEAQLVGDFNNWKGANHVIEKNEFGVWSITLPDVEGKPAIPHGSKVKIRLRKSDGSWADCISAWIKWATVDPHQFAAAYERNAGQPEILSYIRFVTERFNLRLYITFKTRVTSMIYNDANNRWLVRTDTRSSHYKATVGL